MDILEEQSCQFMMNFINIKDKIHHVLTRHEQGATHAAQGFARISGKVGVAMATSGPGATNLITGIADAQIDSTPMFVLQVRYGITFVRK